ncbi:DNA cytosine methyltransferase [Planctomicrobium sp. SH668]|uniref:DNA cytosine methyltransferase n=1 Tax=Planctomicrobium sp. SH668 TaxID=3448126 RepID=UPI003F5AE214
MSKTKVVDLYCGAGGTSIGAEMTGEAEVVFALNHWDVAVQTHSANFPNAKHVNSRVDLTSPGEAPKHHIFFASPECTHHSNARGGKPTSDQQRAGAWDLMPWIEYHRPSYLCFENVKEFRNWGPVGRDGRPLQSGKGKIFEAWIAAIKSMGYRIEMDCMNAADFGAATSRDRLFVICRKGNRSAPFPEPTHSKHPGTALPGMQRMPWRPAYEIIDWSVPCPSIFSRKNQLKDNTLLRIEAGLRRFVEPFVVRIRNNMTASGAADPLGTITAGGRHHGIAVPMQYQSIGRGAGRSRTVDQPVPTIVAARENHGIMVPFISRQFGTKDGQCDHASGIDESLRTITTVDHHALTVPYMVQFDNASGNERRVRSVEDPAFTFVTKANQAVAVPYVLPRQGFYDHHALKRCRGVEEPLPTITASHVPGAVVVPFLSQYYGNGDGSSIHAPIPTIVTKDRHALVTAIIDPACQSIPLATTPAMAKLLATMAELGVADIGFRMLKNHELSAAQGFPADYIFKGTATQITRQIGNSVSPNVGAAITREILAA